jgi:hypothetical protein
VTQVYIRLLADTDLDSNAFDVSTFHECLECEIIIAAVCEGVPIVLFVDVHDQLMLEEELNNFVSVASLEGCQTFYQGDWHVLMVLHSHFDGSQHTEMLFCQIVYQIRV